MLGRTTVVAVRSGGRAVQGSRSRLSGALIARSRGAHDACAIASAVATARTAASVASRSRAFSSTTRLGAYLEACGATWGENADLPEVIPGADGRSFSWRLDLPQERLQSFRRGDMLESPSVTVSSGRRVRFQFFPKGDLGGEGETDQCSLWLWGADASDLGPFQLTIGEASERSHGASEFCSLEDAMGGSSSVDIQLRLQNEVPSQEQVETQNVQQSLQLTGLERAEWQVFRIRDLVAKGDLHTSPPFRFHHVLLGDMYLELLPGTDLITLFFRCRVPTMKLRVGLSVGSAFSKSFIALGKTTYEDDLKAAMCLQVNLKAPGVLEPDGSLKVSCNLEEVVSIPPQLRDMIPKLDERALWPKRL